jgi:hypothetical protein
MENNIIQEIIAFTFLAISIGYLIKNYFWTKKSDKSCGKDDCGCH